MGMGVEKGKLTEVLKQYLRSNYARDYESMEIEISRFREVVDIPEGVVELVPAGDSVSMSSGLLYVPVKVFVDGRFCKTVYPKVRIKVYCKVPVSTRYMKKHQVLRAADIKWSLMDISMQADDTYVFPAEIEGKRLKRNTVAGEVFTMKMLEDLPAIEKGDVVTIFARSGNVSISARGIARECGAVNQLIKVTNVDSRRQVLGIVRDNKRVEIVVSGEAE